MKTNDNIPGKNPFRVPEDYFEEVKNKIISSTAGIEPEVTTAGTLRKIRSYLLAAASVSGFIIISYVAASYFASDRHKSGSDELYALFFTEPFINDIDIYTLEENAAAIERTDEKSGINSSEIIDYLMFENIEINDIYEIL